MTRITINVEDLIFQKVPTNDASQFFCNYCARTGFTAQWWQTKIRVDKKTEFKIVICSDECRDKFIADPRSQELVNDGIRRTKEMAQLKRRRII